MKVAILFILFSSFKNGDIYLSLGDYKNAIIFYSKLLKDSPEDVNLKSKLIFSVEKYIEMVREKFKEVKLEKIKEYYEAGKIDSALIFVRKIYEKTPFYPEIIISYQKLIGTADTLMKLYIKADSAEQLKDFNTAYNLWKIIEKIYPYEKRLKNKLTILSQKTSPIVKYEKKPAPEVKVEKEAIAKKTEENIKEKVNELYKEGIRLYTEGKLKEAKEVWIEILKIDPQNTKVKRNLAVVEERLRAK